MVHRDLFNAAFLSCWSELSEDQQDKLIRSIELALTSQDIAEVTQTLLNLAEFMEHSDKVSIELQQLHLRNEGITQMYLSFYNMWFLFMLHTHTEHI